MNYFEDAKDLIEHSKEKLAKIKQAYHESLDDMIVKKSLLIEVKNFMENLRSALDFSAHGLLDKYGDKSKKGFEVKFPYAWKALTMVDFARKNNIEKCIPGLTTKRPDIAKKIESYQHFSSPDNLWLPKFMDLNNKNKHQELTPQTKVETKELTTTIPKPEGEMKIVFKNGVGLTADKIIYGDQVINGPVTINADNPLPFKGVTHEIKKWTSFNFSINNEPVLPFLENALIKIENIVNELSAL
jgi:hypothetical protein